MAGAAARLAARIESQPVWTACSSFLRGPWMSIQQKFRADGISLGLSENRAYRTWREMLDEEARRSDRLDLVTVATPNATHFEIVRAFLEAEFNVLCEKPFTLDVAEAEELVRLARERKSICSVNFGFSGYPMVRQARAMAKAGELGKVQSRCDGICSRVPQSLRRRRQSTHSLAL